MKKLFLASAVVLVITSAFTLTPEEIQGSVKKGQFYLNDTKLSPVWLLSEALGNLGIPDNVHEAYNNTYTFDNDGIVIFENKFGTSASGKIKEIQFYLMQPDSDGTAPKKTFKGKFLVEKTEITSTIDMASMKTKLKDWTVNNGYRPHSLKLVYEQLFLFCQFSDDEKSLKRISIGLNTVN